MASRPSPPKIIIMGGPASGKGTQCEHIVAKHNVVHLSTGDMLRDVVSKDADEGLGATVKEYMESGKLVPDDIMIQIVVERIGQEDCRERGFLLDGFPRTEAQAKALADNGIEPDVFLFLDVPDEELTKRVTGRRMDPETGKIYHLQFSPPPPNVDVDQLVQRSDDTVDKLKSRLEVFHANVQAVQSCYSDVQVTIDGLGSPSQVAEAVMSRLAEQLESKTAAVHG
uniref:Adenylate kinase active site lid domain-containing protein n=1 Tax=Grammatophora oceanica TaxID=210454 RepID=A0A7S1YHH3_9STRA|eukprot:CAMPEP_0194054840 /NCGR_PEP_ID=MMETSP0009_2-20130614/54719_1 /TAXON_ID=210454 /ORGANISM="Grammatophora oceanica, Strain CCMP 410" /LENGTH=225 /DNA_ID=CAMNT_0038703503 /DNA_START=84 /DNA_END=761 /DNA_ORIENTATION=-